MTFLFSQDPFLDRGGGFSEMNVVGGTTPLAKQFEPNVVNINKYLQQRRASAQQQVGASSTTRRKEENMQIQ